MEINLIYIIVLIILGIYLLGPMMETFVPIHKKVHLKLDRDGNIIYQSFQSPTANGELGCTQIPCPDKYQDEYVCYQCCN